MYVTRGRSVLKLWYYAEGAEAHGPLSLAELVPLLSRIADLRQVKLWRHGFDDWKAVEEVREVAQRVVRPPPSASASPPLPPPTDRGPVVDAADAAEFEDVKPELKAVSGWLGLLAFGQVVGIARLMWSVGLYYTTIDERVLGAISDTHLGRDGIERRDDLPLVYTTVLLFRHSRHFPRIFIWQMIFVICLPLVNLLWVASIISLATSTSFSEHLTIEPKEGARMVAGRDQRDNLDIVRPAFPPSREHVHPVIPEKSRTAPSATSLSGRRRRVTQQERPNEVSAALVEFIQTLPSRWRRGGRYGQRPDYAGLRRSRPFILRPSRMLRPSRAMFAAPAASSSACAA